MRHRLATFIALMALIPLVGVAGDGSADVSTAADHRPLERHVELPRTFQGARLGMGRVDVVRAAYKGVVRSTQEQVVVVPGQDRYVKQVEYLFYNGTLYRLQTHNRSERIPGGADALVMRLKDTYGTPVIDGRLKYGPAPGVLSEKQYVWNDGRTEIALVERERDIESESEIMLIMSDLQMTQMKEEAAREQQRRQINDVPIPMPEHTPANGTAAKGADRADRHVGVTTVRNQSG